MKKNVLLLLLFVVQIAYAQDPVAGAFSTGTGDYHSPEVQALNRYGQIPISYFTGVPEINIPIYEGNICRLKLNLSLSYHASGIKVDDIASVVGLGWVLNAGGVISRNVNGIADETKQRGFLNKNFTSIELASDYDMELMYNTTNGSTLDCAADEFTYNFLGYTGKFSYGIDKEIHLLPFKDLKFEFVDQTYFKVKTPEGHVFLFKDKEFTTINGHGGTTAPTAWHLTKIILNNNAGEIDFSYIAGATYEDRFPSYSSSFPKVGLIGQGSDRRFFSELNGKHLQYSYNATGTKFLSKISFPTGGSL